MQHTMLRCPCDAVVTTPRRNYEEIDVMSVLLLRLGVRCMYKYSTMHRKFGRHEVQW